MIRNPQGISCPVCGSTESETFYTLPSVPVLCHVRYESAEDALAAPTGEISLTCCDHCGMIYNRAFAPATVAYEVAYNNALHFSPHFRRYAEQLANDLCRRHDLQGKNIVEIGCGDGFFLNLLCRNGLNRGWGFDPSLAPGIATSENVHLFQGYLTKERLPVTPDLVCCRHVLEHLPEPRELLGEIRCVCSEARTVVFFEVPDGRYTFEWGGYWDILYEHCSYFTPKSLRRLCELEGFEVIRIESTYGGQFLQAELRPARGAIAPPRDHHQSQDLRKRLRSFGRNVETSVRHWQEQLDELHGQGVRACLWGAGTKGVMFLNAVQRSEALRCIVDINPTKHGLFAAGTQLRILAPEALLDDPPAKVVLMNRIYQSEVTAHLSRLGLAPTVLVA